MTDEEMTQLAINTVCTLSFRVPDGVYEHFAAGIGARGAEARRKWTELFAAYRNEYPDAATEIELKQRRELPSS